MIHYSIEDGAAILTVDNPPVNAMSPAVAAELESALERASNDAEAEAIVIMGAGRTFIAGADIHVLEDAAWGRRTVGPGLHGLLAKIEESAKTVVMAIHGSALGAGLELAMAGHYRIAVPAAQLGQPEVNLGIIPGAEGTQRLPRLVGIERAMEMCVTGKPLQAPEALRAGLIDALSEGDLRKAAVEFARRAGPPRRTRERIDKLGSPDANGPLYAAGRQLAAKVRRNQQAPLRAVDAIEAAASMSFEEGCRRERELFSECIASEQARALIHIFFAERTAAKFSGGPALPVARIAIVGAGTMGGGIAMACANAGLPVLLKEAEAARLDAGLSTIRKNYDISAQRGRFTLAEVERRMALIHPQLDYAGFEQADLIIEAVFENMQLKKQVFGELDAAARPGAVLASNTSTLSIDEIASATSRPEAVIGMHFFSPANVMRLLEIVRGKATSDAVIATAMALAGKLKKAGVLVGNCPGFAGNRMFFPYIYEGQFLVEDGGTPHQVDQELAKFGMAMGLFAVDDMAGIDVGWRIRQELGHFTGAGRKPLVQDQLYAMGRYGQKTGKGWFCYGPDRKPVPDPEVEELIEQSARTAGIERRSIPGQEIVERTIYALINEGARVLEEGFAQRASDIDVIYVSGYGFPSWRGGPMFYADTVGLTQICRTIERFHRDLGERWEPAPLLLRLSAEGRTFRQYDLERR